MTELTYICDSSRHLICLPYSIDNLHKMAAELGIARNWYHVGTYPHYDMPKRRIAEITAKCRVVTAKELLSIIKEEVYFKRKKTGLSFDQRDRVIWITTKYNCSVKSPKGRTRDQVRRKTAKQRA